MNSIELPISPWQKEKWITQASLIGACLCSLCGGVVYAFSLYGPQLAATLGYSSTQLNTIAMAGNLGVLASGPLFGYLADTQKPSLIVKLSSVLFILGFFGMSFTYEGILPYRHFLIMAGYYFLVGAASGCSYINSTSTTGHNFKNYRGFGIGLPVTFFGLSAFLFSIINHIFFVTGNEHDTSSFLRFLGLATSIITLFGSFFLIKVDHNRLIEESRSLRGPLSSGYRAIEPEYSVTSPTSPSGRIQPTCLSLENDISGWDLFLNTDAQLLYFCILLIGGSGLVYINNIGTVLHTLDFTEPIPNLPGLQNLAVSVLSIFNCGGRLLFTALSDYLANLRAPFQRVSWLIVAALLVGSTHLATAYSSSKYIPLCSAILGLGYGISNAVGPTITSVWFGIARFGANWGWMNTSPAVGGQILSITFGLVYDYHIKLDSLDDTNLCKYGVICYQFTFQLMSSLCYLAAFIAFILKWRREYY